MSATMASMQDAQPRVGYTDLLNLPDGADRIVIGTDYPFPWTATPDDARLPRFQAMDHVLDTPGLSDADRIAILGGNAAALFGISV